MFRTVKTPGYSPGRGLFSTLFSLFRLILTVSEGCSPLRSSTQGRLTGHKRDKRCKTGRKMSRKGHPTVKRMINTDQHGGRTPWSWACLRFITVNNVRNSNVRTVSPTVKRVENGRLSAQQASLSPKGQAPLCATDLPLIPQRCSRGYTRV